MSYGSNTAEQWYPVDQPTPAVPEISLDLLPPESLTRPVWKSLLENLRDTFAPEKLPPLQLTSRPVDVGMLLGDRLSLPWFRMVFTNLGDVISPETLPPLELESQPIEVEELLTDRLSHFWWSSLLRNLADRAAPEKHPALQLTAKPIGDIMPKAWLLLPMWSEVISAPKVFYPDKAKASDSAAGPTILKPVPPPPPQAGEVRIIDPAEADVRRDLHRSRIRQRIWVALAAAQAVYLIVMAFWR